MESETKEDFMKYSPSDPELIDKIVNKIKSKGIFDQFRKECLADVDTKPAYQNLQRRVSGTVNGFLSGQKWPCAVNKTQLRESLRKHTVQQSFLEVGVDRIVDQVVMPKIYSVFHPKVEEIVYELLGLEKPKPKPETPPKPKPVPLLDLKPKPQALRDLKLDFQNFKKSLEETVTVDKGKDADHNMQSPSGSKQNEVVPSPVKVEEDSQVEHPDGANTPPPLETNGDAESNVNLEPVSSPINHTTPAEFVKNDDDSNTIDEMPLLAASIDTNSNGATTPIFGSARDDSIPKVERSSDSDSLSLPSSQPRMELDSSANNVSSFKSECKEPESKKFDNFSNLGEKLKQSDVNLRETTPIKQEEITEESSELTKSSEHDSESIELNMEVHSDSNASAMDNSRFISVKNEIRTPNQYSDDSNHSDKSKSKSDDSKNEAKSLSSKHIESTESKSSFEEPVEKPLKMDSNGQSQEIAKKEHKSKHSDSKVRHGDGSKDKSKSHRHRDEKRQKNQESHSSERNGKHHLEKHDEKKDKGADGDKKSKHSDSTKAAEEEKRKKKDDKSHHHKDNKDSKSHKKVEGHSEKGKDDFKTPEKERKDGERSKSDKHKSKSESSRSSHSRSGDRKGRDERKKEDKKEDDRKKDSRKRKSGKCDEDDLKNKNSRRSSDRDSNGNAGGGSDKSKPTGSSSQSHKKSSKSEQKTRSRYKDPSNSDSVEVVDELQVTDEVDLILLQINNSIENEQNRLDVREILNDPGMAQTKKPKIAKNFSEIKKIMQARKNIEKMIGADAVVPEDELVEHTSSISEQEGEQEVIDAAAAADDDDDDGAATPGDGNSLDRIQVKEVSVVLSDVMKESSSLRCMNNVDWDGVSIFLGSSDEIIVGVETGDVCPSSEDSALCDDAQDTKQSLQVDCSSVSQVADCLEADSNIDSCLASNSSSEKCEKADVPIESTASPNHQSVSTDAPIESSVPPNLSISGDAPMESSAPPGWSQSVAGDECLSKGNDPDDETDNLSIKSGRSNSSSSSQTGVAYGIDASDSDSKISKRTREKPIKRKSSDTTPLPSRSTTRKNAGTRMYAILEEVNSSKHSNSPADKGPKKNTFGSRSNSDIDKLAASNSSKVDSCSNESEQLSLTEVVSRTQERADDGSDVSNKENDEMNVSSSSRPKSQISDSSALVETRTSRRKNPSADKLDENLGPNGKNNLSKTRVTLPGKRNAQEPDLTKDDNPGKSSVEVTAKSRRSAAALLNSKIKDSDDPWNVRPSSGSSSRSGSADSLGVLDKVKSNDVRKSMECLQMEKENLSVLQMSSTESSEANGTTLTSPRRKSCPDILHPREYCENKDSVRESENVGDSPSFFGTDDAITNLSKQNLLSKPVVGPQKQYEYCTRNINSRRKSISTGKQTNAEMTSTSSVSSECVEDLDSLKPPNNVHKVSNNKASGSVETFDLVHYSVKSDSASFVKKEYAKEEGVVGSQEQIKGSDELVVQPKSNCRSKMKLESTESLPVEEESNTSKINQEGQQSCYVQSSQDSESSSENKAEGSEAACSVGKLDRKSSRENISAHQPSGAKANESVQKEASREPAGQAKSKVTIARPSTRRTKVNDGNVLPSSGLLEDSASCSSSEFKGFSEEDVESDSEEDCRGFSDLEIRKAIAQFRQLTYFITKRINANDTSQAKKMRVSLGDGLGSGGLVTSLATSTTRKRKLSLSFSPEKDKKEILSGQCKAESKDSGLCESPEQTTLTISCEKPVPVERRVSAGRVTVPETRNGIRTKTVRTASRSDRKLSTDTLEKTSSTKNSRTSQRYCASDLYKPRPSFARDVRAVKRTAASEVSAVGRVKKRSR